MQINLIDSFETTVDSFPYKTAISDGYSEMNFKTLKLNTNDLAAVILKEEKNINKPIAVFLPKGTDAIISFLAILYSGNCYAPLDIKNPASRIKSIVKLLEPITIITNSMYF